jgi:tetraacyldisaccharide 4'-kinase
MPPLMRLDSKHCSHRERRAPVPERIIERRWESTSRTSRLLRAALAPASWLYGTVIRGRNAAYDRGWLASYDLGLPTVSVGNMTVGGTGKTPMAAWFAARFVELGAKPAILLRGYGGDELRVHRILVPGALVIAGADRRASAERARREGATVLVLDDGFQHRRARRDADVVLLSADRHRKVRLLPAGPWREPETALRRATHIVVTRKRTTPLHAREVVQYASRIAPDALLAIVHLAAETLVRWDAREQMPVEALAGKRVLAISAIGDPRAFEAQLRAIGARCAGRTFRDHHAFTERDVRQLSHDATGADYAVCTLKDAVKLGPLWPPSAPPIWYLSQRVNIELGAEILDGLAHRLAEPAYD